MRLQNVKAPGLCRVGLGWLLSSLLIATSGCATSPDRSEEGGGDSEARPISASCAPALLFQGRTYGLVASETPKDSSPGRVLGRAQVIWCKPPVSEDGESPSISTESDAPVTKDRLIRAVRGVPPSQAIYDPWNRIVLVPVES